MRVVIHQPNLLPWFGFFAKLAQADVWIVLDDVAFSRESYTHRVQIAKLVPEMESAVSWLSWPIGGQGGKLIRDLVLPRRCDAEELSERVHHVYAHMKFGHALAPVLSDLEGGARATMGRVGPTAAAAVTTLAQMLLGRSVRAVSSSTLRKEALPGDEGALQLCKAVGATTYIAGAGGAAYANAIRWKAEGVTFRQARFTHPTYEGMPAEGLSVIDAVARIGPQAAAKKLEEAVR